LAGIVVLRVAGKKNATPYKGSQAETERATMGVKRTSLSKLAMKGAASAGGTAFAEGIKSGKEEGKAPRRDGELHWGKKGRDGHLKGGKAVPRKSETFRPALGSERHCSEGIPNYAQAEP